MLRPGEFRITDKAMKICGFEKGAKILEVGCGEGDTTEHLEKDLGYEVSAIDTSLDMVSRTKARGLDAEVKYGDGEFLEGFSSFSFDGVVMECVLSLINMPDEALHESWCVLKKGGKLFISDMCHKDPDPDIMAAVARKAAEESIKPHEEGECSDDCAEDHKQRLVDFRYDGKFFVEPLKKMLKSIGYKIVMEEDRSMDLDSYAAEKMMNGEEPDTCIKNTKKTGYFMLVAEKPL
ncbi:MAG: class I SAM-dependent methyltransferase [Eubacteriaceae bacterium]|nr:class I SAM-dependent methyltransferase [Eubacteriaceae bacterium]